jgi:hypothetical protein
MKTDAYPPGVVMPTTVAIQGNSSSEASTAKIHESNNHHTSLLKQSGGIGDKSYPAPSVGNSSSGDVGGPGQTSSGVMSAATSNMAQAEQNRSFDNVGGGISKKQSRKKKRKSLRTRKLTTKKGKKRKNRKKTKYRLTKSRKYTK